MYDFVCRQVFETTNEREYSVTPLGQFLESQLLLHLLCLLGLVPRVGVSFRDLRFDCYMRSWIICTFLLFNAPIRKDVEDRERVDAPVTSTWISLRGYRRSWTTAFGPARLKAILW